MVAESRSANVASRKTRCETWSVHDEQHTMGATRANGINVYAEFRQQVMAGLASLDRGKPEATAEAVFKVVDAEQPPLRLILDSTALPLIRSVYSERLASWGFGKQSRMRRRPKNLQ